MKPQPQRSGLDRYVKEREQPPATDDKISTAARTDFRDIAPRGEKWTRENVIGHTWQEIVGAHHAALAEKVKPLVELLGECRTKLDWSVTDGEFLQRIDDALAKVKQ